MSQLNKPCGVFVSNGEVYIADTNNHRVRKFLRNGQIVTIAGTGISGYNGDDQLATEAQLHCPHSVVVSSSNQVYIAERYGNRIRKIDRNGIISTIAGTGEEGYNGDGQLAIHAQLYFPCGLFVTEDEEVLFADGEDNHRVRKIDRNGIISTIAGTGKKGFNGDGQLATNASLHNPSSVFQYKSEIYIADSNNFRIRKIDQNGIISTVVENKTSTKSLFVRKGELYFTDRRCLRKILPNGMIKTIAGNGIHGKDEDGNLTVESQFKYPTGLFVDASGIYICFDKDSRIRKVDANGIITTVVGIIEHDIQVTFHLTLKPTHTLDQERNQ